MPVGRCAVVVIGLQGFAVILAVVAEHRPASLEAAAVADQPVPEIVARFVAEVAEQGALGFVHGHTALLAIGVIRFGQRDGEEAVIMSRHDLGAGRRHTYI